MDTKKIVIPGELLSDDSSLSGSGTYVSGGKVYASVCGLLIQKGKFSVHPLSGPYLPKKNDLVIGYVTVVTSSNWIFDIGCPYEGLLHVMEYPIRVPSEEMTQHFSIGDTVLLKVTDVNAEMKIELTYKDSACRKLKKGRLFEVPSSKVSRVIGRSGAMISMLKAKTGCDIFVGGNGRIWMSGSSESMDILMNAFKKIEAEAHVSGLTDLTAAYIDEQYKLLNSMADSSVDSSADFLVDSADDISVDSDAAVPAAADSKRPAAKVKPMSLKKRNGNPKDEGKKEQKSKPDKKSAAADMDAVTNTVSNTSDNITNQNNLTNEIASDKNAADSGNQGAAKSFSAQNSDVQGNETQLNSFSENCTCFNSVFFTHFPTDKDRSDR
jgi:RNA-binding protein Rrp4 and related proteins (contain S1 domain and KH domain)